MPSLSKENRQRILTLAEQGVGPREIGRRVGCVHATVSKTIKRFKETKSNQDRPKSGRPTKLTPRAKRLIARKILSEECDNAVQVHQAVTEQLGLEICVQTVRNTLKGKGFISKKKVKKPLLTVRHKKNRLAFANRYKDWTVEDWKKVNFSDETKINIFGSDGLQYIWKKKGTPISDREVNKTVKFGGGNIMIWGCMTWNGVGAVCQIGRTMDSDLYLEILKYFLPRTIQFREINRDEMIFQHDNDPKHTAKKVKKYLEEEKLQVLDWPSQSPDLNPIEHLWVELKKRLKNLKKRPTSITELKYKVPEVWVGIETDICQNLISSMPRRIASVLKAKGGYTKY
jgi:transposase